MKKPEICAGWMDLARQKETVPTILRYFDSLHQAGMNAVVLYLEDRIKTASYPMQETVDRLSTELEDCTPGDIGRLDIHFFLADVTAAPKTKIILHYDDEDVQVVHQIMKSMYIRNDAHYDISFRIDANRVPKAVTLAVTGYGAIGIAYVDVTLPSGRLVPTGIAKVTGQLDHPEFLLVDDSRAAMFGEQDMILSMHQHPTINDGDVSATLTLG